MKTTPQAYAASTLAHATTALCDIVQPKYHGLWCRIRVNLGAAHVYDPKNDALTHFLTPTNDVSCILIGDLFGPPRHEITKIVVWDCWEANGSDLYTTPYRDRFAFAKLYVGQIGLPLVLIKNYPISCAESLWTAPDPEVCGLVFRSSRDPVAAELLVARRYENAPRALE